MGYVLGWFLIFYWLGFFFSLQKIRASASKILRQYKLLIFRRLRFGEYTQNYD